MAITTVGFVAVRKQQTAKGDAPLFINNKRRGVGASNFAQIGWGGPSTGRTSPFFFGTGVSVPV